MATNEGSIKVKLGLDDSEYKSGLSGAVSKAESFADKVKSTFVGATVFKAASAGWDMITGSIGKATDRLDALSQSTKVMTVLTGSTETATAIVNKLTEAVSDTAYGLDTASSATQKLMTSGLGAEQSAQYIQDLMDAVAFYGDGTNETLANVADGISKMNSSQKISADQWQRLTDAGIPIIKMFAEKTGMSMAEVTAAFESGDISVDEFNQILTDCLENGTESFPAVAGAAKEMAGSFATSFSNMSARIAIGVANIITAFNTFLDDSGLPTIQEAIAGFGSVVKNVLNKIAELLPQVLNAIKEFVEPTGETIKKVLENIKQAWSNLVSAFKEKFDASTLDYFKQNLESVRDALVQAALKASEFIKVLSEHLPEIISIVGKLLPAIVSVGTAIETWKKVQDITNKFKTVKTAADAFFKVVKQGDGLMDGLAYAMSNGSGVIASMAESFTLAGGGIEGVTAALGAIGGPVTIAIAVVAALAAGFIYLWNTSEDFRNFWINLWNQVKEKVEEAYNNLKPTLDDIGRVIREVVEIIGDNLSKLWDSVKDLWQSLKPTIDDLGDLIQNVVKIVGNALSEIWKALQNLWKSLEPTINDLGKTVEEIVILIGEALDDLWKALQNLWKQVEPVINNIKKALEKLWEALEPVFEQLGQAISNAFKDWSPTLETVGSAISDFAGQAISYFGGFITIIGSVVLAIINVITWFVNFAAKLVEFITVDIPQFIDGVNEWFSKLPETIQTWIDQTLANITQWVSDVVNQAIEVGTQFINAIVEWFTQLPGNIENFISQALQKVATWASNMAGQAKSAGSNFLSGIAQFMSQVPGKVAGFLSNVISNAAGFVSSFASQAKSAGQQFFNGIVTKMQSIPAQMKSVGSDIVSGIQKGISSGWSSLCNWLGSMASSLVDTVKSFLGIGSPSRVFASKVGTWIPAGITLGIEQAMPKALDYMGTMSDELVNAAGLDNISARLALTSTGNGLGALGGQATVYNVEQTINSAKALTPSEIATETQNMMRRLAWQ